MRTERNTKAPAKREPSLELIWGADGIGQFIGKNTKATTYLLRRGHLPSAKKVGREWVASPEGLRRDLGVPG